MKLDYQTINEIQLDKYRNFYKPSHYALRKEAGDFFTYIAQFKIDLIKKWYKGGKVLDLCCGAGDFLEPISPFVDEITGIDFSPEMISFLQGRIISKKIKNAQCFEGNARNISLKDNDIDFLFSYSALYSIPDVSEVIKECSRIMKPSGIAVFDFGISHSLNTLVCEANSETTIPCHISLGEVHKILKESGFKIKENHAFQILPYWGNKPEWMRSLLNSRVKEFMQKKFFGLMLDEIICKIWPFSHFAFRRIIVCEKPAL